MQKTPTPWWIWLLPLPLIWWAAAAMAMRWQPGMNLSGLLSACNEMLAQPLPLAWSSQTPRFLLIFTGLYAVIALVASSEHRNTRPGEEHGSARWGNAKELNRRYRDTQGPNLLMTRNFRIGVDGYKHKHNTNVLIVGGAGAGKTRTYAVPNVLEAGCSMVITDPKGEILRKTGGYLKQAGYAYLVACVLWQLQKSRQMQRPVVISTASVALQNAILTEYIPFLSEILIQNGYIQKPICAVLRKGKERFACDRRLLIRQKQIGIRGERFRSRAAALRAANQCLDLDLLPGISRHDRRLICVPERCSRSCILHSDCRYRQYLKDSNGASVTIQVCNHNYLLADAAHRQNGWKPLLKDYQALVIDEAHKLPETVRQMNTRRIRSSNLLHFEKILTTSHCALEAQKLRGARRVILTAFELAENELEREKSLRLTTEQAAALQHLNKTIQEILKLENKEMPPVLRNKLSDVQKLIPLFLRSDTTFVRYVEYHQENGSMAIDLCAVPFDLPKCVYDALWREQKPAILTSGTLAVGSDFTRTEQQFGLDHGTAVRTLRISSPFHYDENCLLYFPATYRKKASHKQDTDRVAHQIQELISTAHGHTLVLFTSYDQMGRVYEKLKDKFPVPVLQAQRNPQIYLERFKQLPNAVLFASGACWEGVDFPGDMVSLLIIVKLPFQVPDPLGEAMRKQYSNLHSYIRAEVVPEMQIKLRQGFGRAIRTETDSCVVAILDPRAAPGKRYHQAVLDALPEMPVSNKLTDVQSFLRSKKIPSYFEPQFPKEVDSHEGDLFHSGSQEQ